MSLWDNIRDKILPPRKNKPTIDELRDKGMFDGPNIGGGAGGTATAGTAAAPAQTTNQSTVDVEEVLESKLRENSSLDNRKQLAEELGYTGTRDGSAEMNIWLHKEVMRRLAANGGTVPSNLTD
jgi:hypothetical protein